MFSRDCRNWPLCVIVVAFGCFITIFLFHQWFLNLNRSRIRSKTEDVLIFAHTLSQRHRGGVRRTTNYRNLRWWAHDCRKGGSCWAGLLLKLQYSMLRIAATWCLNTCWISLLNEYKKIREAKKKKKTINWLAVFIFMTSFVSDTVKVKLALRRNLFVIFAKKKNTRVFDRCWDRAKKKLNCSFTK